MAKRKYNRKRKSRPTVGRRSEKQKARDRLAHAQDDAQRLGVIPLTPEEALKTARVDPSTQGEQKLPHLIQRAMTGWAVPAEKQPQCVDELVDMIKDKSEDAPSPIVKVAAFNALVKGHALQHEIDNPKVQQGTEVNVNIQNNNLWQPIFEGQAEHRDEIEERLKQVQVKVEQQGELVAEVEPGGPVGSGQ